MIAATILQRDVAVSTFTLWEIALLHREGAHESHPRHPGVVGEPGSRRT